VSEALNNEMKLEVHQRNELYIQLVVGDTEFGLYFLKLVIHIV